MAPQRNSSAKETKVPLAKFLLLLAHHFLLHGLEGRAGRRWGGASAVGATLQEQVSAHAAGDEILGARKGAGALHTQAVCGTVQKTKKEEEQTDSLEQTPERRPPPHQRLRPLNEIDLPGSQSLRANECVLAAVATCGEVKGYKIS